MSTANHPTQAVFEQVLARPVTSPDLHHGRLVHVVWRAPQQGDRLTQFYLNGRLSGSSRSTTQRDAWLIVNPDNHTQVELLAVCPLESSTDQSELLAGTEPATRPTASLRLLRDVSMPIGSTVAIKADSAAADDRSPLFSPNDSRAGFGAVFGEGGFGYDASTGPGLGLGALEFGPLGTDGDALSWYIDTLPAGTHSIMLSLEDRTGQTKTQEQSVAIAIDRLPAPPDEVALNDDFHLTWT